MMGGMGMHPGVAIAMAGGFGLMILIGLALLILIIVAIVWLVKDLKRRSLHQQMQTTPAAPAP